MGPRHELIVTSSICLYSLSLCKMEQGTCKQLKNTHYNFKLLHQYTEKKQQKFQELVFT